MPYRFKLHAILLALAAAAPAWGQSGGSVTPSLLRAAAETAGKPTGATATAPEACLAGRYIHKYVISAGADKGDAWMCCVPIKELLRPSFTCGGLQQPRPGRGTANDQKVQTCSLRHPTSSTAATVRACKPAQTSTPKKN
jgi:hypothetical protein